MILSMSLDSAFLKTLTRTKINSNKCLTIHLLAGFSTIYIYAKEPCIYLCSSDLCTLTCICMLWADSLKLLPFLQFYSLNQFLLLPWEVPLCTNNGFLVGFWLLFSLFSTYSSAANGENLKLLFLLLMPPLIFWLPQRDLFSYKYFTFLWVY